MSWPDVLTLALRGLRRRPGRAALSIAAVALATALMVALLAIARTAESQVLDQLAEGGPISSIKVGAGAPLAGQVEQDDLRIREARDLDDGALDRIRAIPEVKTALPVVSAGVLVDRPVRDSDGEPLEAFEEQLVGADLSRPGDLPVTTLTGRLPRPGSLVEAAVTQSFLARVGVPAEEAASLLGTEVRVGSPRVFDDPRLRENLHFRTVRLEIVGVVAQDAGIGEFLVPLDQAVDARRWSLAGVDGGAEIDVPTSDYSGVVVVADGIDSVSEVRRRINEIGFATAAPENLVASVQNYIGVVEIVLAAVGLIAVTAAALGITNALLAAVRERRREIGVLKAIGATDGDVERLFLVESALVGLAGGLLGTAAGTGVAVLVREAVNGYLVDEGLGTVPLTLSPWLVVAGVSGATVLSVLSGVVPARRAARLSAREAVAGP
jgi:ABC-type antimicrobial peptide transport system permease subunit